jgi:hypothetical protein
VKGAVFWFVTALATIPTGAYAQFEVNPRAPGQRNMPGRLQVSGFVGGMTVDQSLGTATNLYQSVTGAATDISFGNLYGFRASWGFIPNLAAEFNLSSSSNAYTLEVDDLEVGKVDLGEQFRSNQLYFGGNVVYQFPLGNLAPYVTGGVGLARTTPAEALAGIDRVSALDFNVGGGLKYWFSSPQWLGLRADLRYHRADDGLTFSGDASSPKGWEYSAGASFRWF